MIKETCSCGATFETDEKFWTYANEGVAAWRRDHKHDVRIEVPDMRPNYFPPAPPEGEFPG